MSPFTFRHPTQADLAHIVHVFNETSRGIPGSKILTEEEMRAELFADEDYDPQGAWLAFAGNSAIGYGDGFVDKKRVEYGKNDGAITIQVVPGWRGKGVEEQLMDLALDHLRSRGVPKAQIWSADVHEWRIKVIREKGFQEVRRFYLMKRVGEDAPEKPSYPPGITVDHRTMKGASDADFETLVQIRNESFQDHYNFSPATVARYKTLLEATDEVYSATFARHEGRVVGLVLSEDRVSSMKQTGEREGWVATLGVAKPYRRKGLGRALLLESIGWLHDRGATLMRLGVDGENSKALGLYTSVGFELEWGSVLAEKSL